MPDSRTIVIIIPTYRPGEKFIRLLSMLKRQTVPYQKLIVVNTEESGMPGEAAEALSGMPSVTLRHISKAEFDHAGTRRAAAAEVTAPYFLCMTDDAVPADDYLLERLLEGFRDPDAAVVYARQLPWKDTAEAEKFTRRFNYPDSSRKKTINDLEQLGI